MNAAVFPLPWKKALRAWSDRRTETERTILFREAALAAMRCAWEQERGVTQEPWSEEAARDGIERVIARLKETGLDENDFILWRNTIQHYREKRAIEQRRQAAISRWKKPS